MTKAPKCDVLIHFQKPIDQVTKHMFHKTVFDVSAETVRLATEIIEKKGFADSRDVLDALTVEWFTFQYSVEGGQTDGELTLHTVSDVLSKEARFKRVANKTRQLWILMNKER